MDARKIAGENLIYKVVAGSHSYGLNTESSDMDYRGVFIEPKNVTLGLFDMDQVNVEGNDEQWFGLKKFTKLALDNNPNIIELLFTPQENVLHTSPEIEKMLASRDKFLCQRAKYSFVGYAVSQLKRIQGHKRQIVDPQPKDAPHPKEFLKKIGFAKVVAKAIGDDSVAFENIGTEPVKLFDVDGYRSAFKRWRQYWEWKNARNKQRAETEEKFGFDTKNAMHLVRLLHMGHEIMTTGEVIVKRPDAEFLMAIRAGKYDYDYIVSYAEKLMSKIEGISSPAIPKTPNRKHVNDLIIEIYESFYGKGG